ncbi:hypothetical protein [Billgrantia desiderata]|uniref:Tripartite tricarboxylate transporter TctB family protein n=1 Tax=Billgrantia desiderata TaxID=52021 RepID=A0ABS9B9U4_9GAMM|nr:hypothetical protein [Halomonas desiderata]MCE8030443.1 hypothetical protein [Halomonas desiderata]MCE8044080.1 hypothetical protein [Halomonas desiderata]MCE8048654.1 hypothetical protein [Halomonas desiderata]OUE40386.1 hypothetical protein BZY95_14010 [Halomonas desiderata SP1]
MSFQALSRALLVPCFILLMTGLYWVSIQDAPSSAQRVPNVVMLFILVMATVVVMRDVVLLLAKRVRQTHEPLLREHLTSWFDLNRQRCLFTVIGMAYFPAFVSLGFNIANLLFLCLALPLSGLGKDRPLVARVGLVVGVAVLASVIFHLLASIMDFNVPAPLGI